MAVWPERKLAGFIVLGGCRGVAGVRKRGQGDLSTRLFVLADESGRAVKASMTQPTGCPGQACPSPA
jgi:hypothetical protein